MDTINCQVYYHFSGDVGRLHGRMESTLLVKIFNIPLVDWFMASGALFATIYGRGYLHNFLKKLKIDITGNHRGTRFDIMVLEAGIGPGEAAISCSGLWLTLYFLGMDASLNWIEQLKIVLQGAGVFILLWFLWGLINLGVKEFELKKSNHSIDVQMVRLFGKLGKLILIIGGVLAMAQDLGYSVSGFVASLGIGGIAIAMAARDSIANIFGSIMLIFDQPFKVGDEIKTDDFSGVVEEIGFRSTKIKSDARTVINIPNNKLASAVIDNLAGNENRRVVWELVVSHDSGGEQIRKMCFKIEVMIKAMLGESGNDDVLVTASKWGEAGLTIQIMFFLENKTFAEAQKNKQDIALNILTISQNHSVKILDNIRR